MKTLVPTFLLTLTFSLLANLPVSACEACYNSAGSDKMNKAASIGIFAMVIIMFVMLGAVIAFGFHLRNRARNPLPDYGELLENPPLDDKPDSSS